MIDIIPATMDCLEELKREAALDGHSVLLPTQVLMKAGKIAGYLSVAAIPTVYGWLSTKHMKVRDTLQVRDWLDTECLRYNAKSYFIPMCHDSPIVPMLEKLTLRMKRTDSLYFRAIPMKGNS